MVAILGVLAGVVVVNVVGLTGRGEKESYATDESTIQSSVSVFYSDTHGYSATGGWNEAGNYTSVHNYPISKGTVSNLYLGVETSMGKYRVNEVWSAPNTPATTPEIVAAAIWMGLLTNGPGEGNPGEDKAPPDDSGAYLNAPLAGEHGPYLDPLPRSCSGYNATKGTGSITWIVGKSNMVYGVFPSDQNGDGIDEWYAGFGGRYP